MQRFFIDHIPQAVEIFENDIFHQTTRVLRMQKGDKIILFCGDWLEYLYEFDAANKKSVTFVQKSILPKENREAPKNITLYQALPNKLEKLEWIIEKNTEIGVKKIVFFRSDRSQKLFLNDVKKERLKKISLEALEQCGWLFPVEIIFSEKNLEQICASRPQDEYGIMLHTTAKNIILKIGKKMKIFEFLYDQNDDGHRKKFQNWTIIIW